jgi:hypothetical protein
VRSLIDYLFGVSLTNKVLQDGIQMPQCYVFSAVCDA